MFFADLAEAAYHHNPTEVPDEDGTADLVIQLDGIVQLESADLLL
jgi:hypothetical protein